MLALSSGPIVHGPVDAPTRTAAIENFRTRLIRANWADAALADGYRYLLTSEQGLKCKVTMRDTGRDILGTPCIDVTFMSDDEARVGPAHYLKVGSGWEYQIVCTPAQAFISVLAVVNERGSGTSVAGGIAYAGGTAQLTVGTGICGTNGTDVLWAGGAMFDASWAGKTIDIAGVTYTIFLVDSGWELHLTTSAGVQGGVPFTVPSPLVAPASGPCAYDRGSAADVAEDWWSYGDTFGVYGYATYWHPSFRTGWSNTGGGQYAGCYNGDLLIDPANGLGCTRLAPFKLPGRWTAPVTRLASGQPLYLPPWLVWGSGVGGGQTIGRLRGLIWDAVWVTEDRPLDQVDLFDDEDWVNFSHYLPGGAGGTFYGCLYLRRTISAANARAKVSGYAY